jgi:hypothetical protein
MPIGALFMILSGTILNPKTDKSSLKNADQDSLKTDNSYSINLVKDESIKFSISDNEWLYDKNNNYFKLNDTITIQTKDFAFFSSDENNGESYFNLIENKNLEVPEELNLYNSKSNTNNLKSLMIFSFSHFPYNIKSWWRYYVFESGDKYIPTNIDWNKEYHNPSTDRIDIKMMEMFHDFMRNKLTREIIYESIKQNYIKLNAQLTVFQKRVLLSELHDLISFCSNYNLNRKKYLNGRTSVTEKPGEYDFSAGYGYETLIEGFLFRRIEFDNVPPLELAQFLKELKLILANSLNSSDFNSNMSCEINEGKLKINSYANSKNKIGFLIRSASTTNSYFVPSPNIKLTKLEIKGKNYWRIVFDEGKQFITLNENLVKI